MNAKQKHQTNFKIGKTAAAKPTKIPGGVWVQFGPRNHNAATASLKIPESGKNDKSLENVTIGKIWFKIFIHVYIYIYKYI